LPEIIIWPVQDIGWHLPVPNFSNAWKAIANLSGQAACYLMGWLAVQFSHYTLAGQIALACLSTLTAFFLLTLCQPFGFTVIRVSLFKPGPLLLFAKLPAINKPRPA
jgi:hypothetical protein